MENSKDYLLSREKRPCRVYVGIHIIEIVEREKQTPSVSRFRRLDKERYLDKVTGEIRYYNDVGKRRSENLDSLKKSFVRLRRLINYNFGGWNSELHIVLTYCEYMTDYYQARNDFKNFWGRFKRRYPMCEYISVCEPQERGSWHIHVLIKRNDRKYLWIPNEETTAIWKNGETYTGRLPFADNFGAYFSAICYRSKEDASEVLSQYKYTRLKYYPDTYRVYSCSRGITRVTSFITTLGNAEKMVEGLKLVMATEKEILDPKTNEHLNTMFYKQYNKRIE